MGAGREASSATVWRGEDVVVERYRYAPGPRISLAAHFHEEVQVCFSPDEDGAYRCRGATHPAPRRALAVVPPGEVHATVAPSWRDRPARYDVLYLPPALVAGEGGTALERLSFPDAGPLRDEALLAAFARVVAACRHDETALARDAALRAFAARLRAAGGASPRAERPARLSEAALRRVRNFIHENHARELRAADLAAMAGCSEYHLAECFRVRFGLPPHAWQLAARVERARRLLAEGMTPAAAALAVGFYDQSHLGRHFKRLVGVTPARYAADPRNVLYADDPAGAG